MAAIGAIAAIGSVTTCGFHTAASLDVKGTALREIDACTGTCPPGSLAASGSQLRITQIDMYRRSIGNGQSIAAS